MTKLAMTERIEIGAQLIAQAAELLETCRACSNAARSFAVR